MGNTGQKPPWLTPRTVQEWSAVLPQVVGLFGLVLQAVFWAVTAVLNHGQGLYEPAFITAFGGLVVVGQGLQGRAEAKRPPPEPPSLRREEDRPQ